MFWGMNVDGRFANTGRKTCAQRLGARDLLSGGRADGHKQAGFTPAVKRNARRASSAARTACLVQTGLRVLWASAEKAEKKIGGKVPPDGIVAEP